MHSRVSIGKPDRRFVRMSMIRGCELVVCSRVNISRRIDDGQAVQAGGR